MTLLTRRALLQAGIAGWAATPWLSAAGHAASGSATSGQAIENQPAAGQAAARPYRLGLIADLHHGLAPTALARLRVFLEEVERHRPDAVLQLGDFNYGKPDSRECMEVWNQFTGPKYHVLGNHDLDVTSKEHIQEFWEMPGRYYSFDARGFHVVVLDRNHLFRDGNYEAYRAGNYYVDGRFRGFVDPEQLEWLQEDLAATTLPTAVFAHQGLGMPDQRYPTPEANGPIERVLAEANRGRVVPKVVACFCGHHHVDRYYFRDGIHYTWINSASYHWVGSDYGRMAAYRDPLFCFLTLHANGSITLEGRETTWESPTPAERGYPQAERLNTYIKSRQLSVG